MKRLIALALAAGCVGLDPAHDLEVKEPGGDTGILEVGDFTLSPGTLHFGDVAVGRASTAQVALAYTGETGAALVDADILDGQGGFTLLTATFPSSLDPGGSVVLEVQFTPSQETGYQGTLEIHTDLAEPDTLSVDLSGQGVAGDDVRGDLQCLPSTVEFGTVSVGDSTGRTVTISNNGAEDLLLTAVTTGDTTLSTQLGFQMPYVLTAGSSRQITAHYTPVQEGDLDSWLKLTTDSPESPECVVAATGEAVNPPSIRVDTGGDPYAMDDFYSWLGMTDSRNLVIWNQGGGTLTITDVYINNDIISPNGTFTVNWRGSRVDLQSSQSHRLQVTFRATGAAYEISDLTLDMNTLHILSNDPYQADYVISLGGIGI